jgi:hypothetical protein
MYTCEHCKTNFEDVKYERDTYDKHYSIGQNDFGIRSIKISFWQCPDCLEYNDIEKI